MFFDQDLLQTRRACQARTVALGHLGLVGLHLMAAIEAPHD
jgi:hypothetical protein